MMRAIQVSVPGDISALKLLKIPTPKLASNQILVNNKFSGVNFIDTYHRTGLYKLDLPFVPGRYDAVNCREGSGIVIEIGADVQEFAVGDRVAYTGTSTYAEFTAVNQEFCVKLPDSITFEVGAAMLLQGLTCFSLARMMHPVQRGETVLIHAAAGGTGSLLVQLCKNLGATVIGTTSTESKKKLALEAGADYVILYKSEDILENVMRITKNIGVDAVFDGVGKSTFDTSLKCLKLMGSMVSFGNASGKVDPIDIMKLVPKCIRLSRPSLFQLVGPKEFGPLARELLEMIDQSKLALNISKIYELEDVGSAHRDLESQNTTGKIILKC